MLLSSLYLHFIPSFRSRRSTHGPTLLGIALLVRSTNARFYRACQRRFRGETNAISDLRSANDLGMNSQQVWTMFLVSLLLQSLLHNNNNNNNNNGRAPISTLVILPYFYRCFCFSNDFNERVYNMIYLRIMFHLNVSEIVSF